MISRVKIILIEYSSRKMKKVSKNRFDADMNQSYLSIFSTFDDREIISFSNLEKKERFKTDKRLNKSLENVERFSLGFND